ncbi:MAG: type II toxin-antitoxin system VapC family toxin [Terriglobales bacterium]
MRRVLVDAGPLVAIVSERDQHHRVCQELLNSLRPPLLTCWPTLTEAAWLLRNRTHALRKLLDSCSSGFFHLLELDEHAPAWIADFLRRYEKLGAQLADAALVYLAEREKIDTVFTLDRRDFSVYRLAGGRGLKLLP